MLPQQQAMDEVSPFQSMLLSKINLAQQMNQQSHEGNEDALSAFFLPMMMQQSMPNPFNKVVEQQGQPSTSYQQKMSAYGNNSISQNGMMSSQTALSKQPPTNEYNGLIEQAANKYGIDVNLIHSIIKMESNYNPHTKSHAGAVGLMQLMPITAKTVGVTDRYNIAQNIDGGTHYFSKMLKEQNGDVRMALAAYNAGPGNVKKYGGVPPFKETQNYIRKVMDYYKA